MVLPCKGNDSLSALAGNDSTPMDVTLSLRNNNILQGRSMTSTLHSSCGAQEILPPHVVNRDLAPASSDLGVREDRKCPFPFPSIDFVRRKSVAPISNGNFAPQVAVSSSAVASDFVGMTAPFFPLLDTSQVSTDHNLVLRKNTVPNDDIAPHVSVPSSTVANDNVRWLDPTPVLVQKFLGTPESFKGEDFDQTTSARQKRLAPPLADDIIGLQLPTLQAPTVAGHTIDFRRKKKTIPSDTFTFPSMKNGGPIEDDSDFDQKTSARQKKGLATPLTDDRIGPQPPIAQAPPPMLSKDFRRKRKNTCSDTITVSGMENRIQDQDFDEDFQAHNTMTHDLFSPGADINHDDADCLEQIGGHFSRQNGPTAKELGNHNATAEVFDPPPEAFNLDVRIPHTTISSTSEWRRVTPLDPSTLEMDAVNRPSDSKHPLKFVS